MSLILAQQSASPTAENVVGTVGQFSDLLLAYIVALAAVGAFSMVLVEALKKLLDSRTRFHTRRWTQWVARSPFDASVLRTTEPLSLALAYGELLQLCTGVARTVANDEASLLLDHDGHVRTLNRFFYRQLPVDAIFALDLKHMLGSIQEAADVALASPAQHKNLYLLMTSGAEPRDIVEWHDKGPDGLIAIADPNAEDRRAIKEHADRFARLRQIVRRKLDGFQLYASDRWASWNQIVANIVGMIGFFLILFGIRNTSRIDFSFPTILALSLFGGILSPLAKDLFSALSRVKDG
jgi:hypothetical protein